MRKGAVEGDLHINRPPVTPRSRRLGTAAARAPPSPPRTPRARCCAVPKRQHAWGRHSADSMKYQMGGEAEVSGIGRGCRGRSEDGNGAGEGQRKAGQTRPDTASHSHARRKQGGKGGRKGAPPVGGSQVVHYPALQPGAGRQPRPHLRSCLPPPGWCRWVAMANGCSTRVERQCVGRAAVPRPLTVVQSTPRIALEALLHRLLHRVPRDQERILGWQGWWWVLDLR